MKSRKKRMEDIRVAKDKKMKKVAIGLSVVFVGVLAFEVLPLVLHGGGGSPAAAPAAAPTTSAPTTATGTPAPAATPVGTATAAVAPTATSTKLTNSDQTPNVGKAQLYSFSQFSGRDPFAQQIVDATAGQPDAAGQDASGNPTQTGSSTASSSTSTSTGTTAAVTHHQPTRTLAVTGAARIAVNGRVQVVRVGASFPSANPLFRLISVTNNNVAKIGLANGSYSSGAKAVSLRTGRSLTLVDTADGIRYQIRLVS